MSSINIPYEESIPENDPSTLNISPGIQLTELQRKHVALVLDLFQGHGSQLKLNDGFSEDSVYEDLFASAKNRVEVAGQLLHIKTVTKSSTTKSYIVSSSVPGVSTTTGSGKTVTADEIHIDFKHQFVFKLGPTINMDTTLIIFSSATEEGGKIVRLQDRPTEEIPDNSLINFFRKLNAVGVPKVVGLPE